MSFIKNLKLPNKIEVDATYDYIERIVHVCEKENNLVDDLSNEVLKYKEFIKERLIVNNKIKYFVIYTSLTIEVINEEGDICEEKIDYINEYFDYVKERLRRIFN